MFRVDSDACGESAGGLCRPFNKLYDQGDMSGLPEKKRRNLNSAKENPCSF